VKRLVLVLVAVLVFVFGFAGVKASSGGVTVLKSVARTDVQDRSTCEWMRLICGSYRNMTCSPDGICWRPCEDFPAECADCVYLFNPANCCLWVMYGESDEIGSHGPSVGIQDVQFASVQPRYIVQRDFRGLKRGDILIPVCGSPMVNMLMRKVKDLQDGHFNPWKVVRKDQIMDVQIDDGLLKAPLLQFAGVLGGDLSPQQIENGYKAGDLVLLEDTAVWSTGTYYFQGKLIPNYQEWVFRKISTGQVSVDKYGTRIWH